MHFLENLNPQQCQAVTHINGPLLVMAGAGSGKTKVLTSRIAYLISQNIAPHNILAITFTNKAAQEMKDRIATLLPHKQTPFIGTFHSLCTFILRTEQYPFARFAIYDTNDQLQLIKDIIKEDGSQDAFSPYGYKDYISKIKNGLSYDATDYSLFIQSAQHIYQRYQEKLILHHALDFDDLLVHVLQLFNKKPETLSKYQNRFTHIMVDEYQDTNTLQYQLVSALARKHNNLCVVGDADQAIYAWRGADFKNILSFENDYPNTKIIKLEENYRSTQTILDAAHHIIKKNTLRKEKTLWTNRVGGEKINIHSYQDQYEEANATIECAITLSKQGTALRDMVILYRTNAQSRALEEACLARSVPYRVIGAFRFYERKEIKDIISYLRFIESPHDILSLRRIINTPPRGLASINELLTHIEKNGFNNDLLLIGTPRKRSSIKRFIELIETLRKEKNKKKVSIFIQHVVKETGYLHYINDGFADSKERIENISELINIAQEFDHYGSDGLQKFLESVALIQESDNYDKNSNAINLMTVHAVKGLEFSIVFITGLEEGIFPHSRSQDLASLEEERRLCYVGFTRAKDKLFLSFVKTRKQFGNSIHNTPSRFLFDIPQHLITLNDLGEWDSNDILID